MKTWKESNEPDVEAKKNRILELYDIADGKTEPGPGRPVVVICMDEFGPLNLQPHPGKHWAGVVGAIAIVLDSFSPHLSTKKDQLVGEWAVANNVELAYAPLRVLAQPDRRPVPGAALFLSRLHRPRLPPRRPR